MAKEKGLRKELEQIIFEGTLSDSVEIMGRTWTLQTIDTEDMVDVMKASSIIKDNTVLANVIAKECVSRALIAVDDIQLKDKEEAKEFVSKLNINIVGKLYQKYIEMNEKLNGQIDDTKAEELKN